MPYRVKNYRITIGEVVFNFCGSIEIESDWRKQTDTCTLTITNEITFNGTPLRELIQVDQPVKVELGYTHTDFVTEFEGYVARSPKAASPYEVYCEDEMFMLKKGSITQNWENTTLVQVLQDIAPGYTVDAVNVTIKKFSVANATPAQTIALLQKVYLFKTFFRQGILVCGKPYSSNDLQNEPIPIFHFQQNVQSNSNNLHFVTENDVPLLIKGVSYFQNGEETIEYETGKAGGSTRTIPFANLSYEDLKKAVDAEFERYDLSGYVGDFSAFGRPYCRHGQKVFLTNQKHPEQDGYYYVDATVATIGTGQLYTRTIKLGKKAE